MSGTSTLIVNMSLGSIEMHRHPLSRFISSV